MTSGEAWRVVIVGEEEPLTVRLIELLLDHSDVSVQLASPRPVTLFRPRVSSTFVSLASPDTLVSVLRGTNLAINALAPTPQARMTVFRAALEAGVSAMDVLQDMPSLLELEGHRKDFEDRYMLFVPGAGFSPGLTSILATALTSVMEEVESLEIVMALRRSGEHESRDYHKMAEALARPPRIYAEERLVDADPDDVRSIALPVPVGVVSARVVDHDELYLLPSILPRTRITVRAALLGMLGNGYSAIFDRVARWTEGHTAGIRMVDALDSVMRPSSTESAVRVEAVGTKRGVRVRTAYTVVDTLTEMNAVTGAAVAMAILTMRAMGSGLTSVVEGFAPDVLLHGLATFGLRYVYEEEVLHQ